jgi:hypothetical protein
MTIKNLSRLTNVSERLLMQYAMMHHELGCSGDWKDCFVEMYFDTLNRHRGVLNPLFDLINEYKNNYADWLLINARVMCSRKSRHIESKDERRRERRRLMIKRGVFHP